MKAPDDQLVRRFAQRRDEPSFRALYRAYTPRLYALALRLSGEPGTAEELTQETWLRALERHDAFTGASRYSTWVSGILINCFRERGRREGGQSAALTDAAGDTVESFELAPTVTRIDIDRALAALPLGYREVVILHDINGFTHREISDLLGLAEGTTKSQLNRGRARLRDLLGEIHRPTQRQHGDDS